MTDLLRILPSFAAGPFASLLGVVEQHGITTTDLLALHPADLAKQTHIPLLDLKRFVAAVQASLSDDLTPDEHFLDDDDEEQQQVGPDAKPDDTEKPKDEQETPPQPVKRPQPRHGSFISTLDDTLDAALGGGVAVGCVTEFAGESGAGKTQFMLALSLAVQLPPPRGLGKNALYISTESGLATRRLAQMLSDNPILQTCDYADKPSLDNILSTVTPDLESQEHILEYQVPVLLERNSIGLIVLDSVAANYRAEFEHQGSRGSNMAARSTQLVRLGSLLRDLARRHGIAVVVANQVADRFASSFNLPRPLATQRGTAIPPESPLGSRSDHMPPPPTLSSTPSSSMPFPPSEDGPPAPPVLQLDHQQRWFTGWGDEPRPSKSHKTPSLGLVWSTQIACRVALIKRPVYGRPRRIAAPLDAEDDDQDNGPTLRSWRRWMKVVFAPHVAPAGQGVNDAPEFQVTMAGLKSKVKG